MPDHEFEKSIQEKMAELRLPPSAPVWDKVEQQLNKQDKRRRGVIWLPVLLAAAVGVFFLINRSIDTPAEPETGKPIAKTGNSSTLHKHITQNIDSHLVHAQDGVMKDPLIDKDTAIALQTLTNQKPSVVSLPNAENGLVTVSMPKNKKARVLTGNDELVNREPHPVARPATNNTAIKETMRELLPSAVKNEPVNAQKINVSAVMHIPDFQPTETKRAAKKKPRLEFGVAVSGGRSHITNGEISSLFENASAFSTVSDRAGNFSGAGAGPVAAAYVPPSRLRAGAAFSAGGYVKKQLTPAVVLSLGLNFKLFSTTNPVGRQKDTVIQNSPNSQLVLNEIHSTGNTNRYTNYFHFIELPLMAEGRLVNGKLPLLWNAGVSYSRLIASNAIHYDSRYRIYYKQNDLLQKNQFNVHAALTTKLSLTSNKPLVLGPEFSYGVTNLLKEKNNNARHFMFIGLKTSMSVN